MKSWHFMYAESFLVPIKRRQHASQHPNTLHNFTIPLKSIVIYKFCEKQLINPPHKQTLQYFDSCQLKKCNLKALIIDVTA